MRLLALAALATLLGGCSTIDFAKVCGANSFSGIAGGDPQTGSVQVLCTTKSGQTYTRTVNVHAQGADIVGGHNADHGNS